MHGETFFKLIRKTALLMRQVDHVTVIMDLAFIESFHDIRHRAKQRNEPHTETAAKLPADISIVDGADELTGGIHRKGSDICVEVPP